MKSSPEYQLKKLNLVFKKPWVATINDERDKGGSILVELKEGYEFLSENGLKIKKFSTVDEVQSGTVKSNIKQII
jgi:hypothetical protein